MTCRRLPVLLAALVSLLATARGEFHYFDAETGFGPFASGREWQLRCDTLPASPRLLPLSHPAPSEVTIMAQVANLRGAPGATGTYIDATGAMFKTARPGILFLFIGESGDTLSVGISSVPLGAHDELVAERFRVTCALLSADGLEERAEYETDACGNSPFHNGSSAVLSPELNPGGERGRIRISEGAEGCRVVWESDLLPPLMRRFLEEESVTAAGLAAMPGAVLDVRRLAIAYEVAEEGPAPYERADVAALLSASSDRYAGYWQLLDFSTDDSMLRSGGEYVCALLPAGEGRYHLVYLSGAIRNASAWTPGRVKAELRPAAVPGAYKAVWYDAEGVSIDEDCAVQMESSRLLTVQFPHLGSTLRMNKIRPPEDF